MKVFLSVGTHPRPFDRLLREMDRVAGSRKDIEVFAQAGNCKYRPKNFAFEKFLNNKGFLEKIGWADVVVSHGGAGTLINALRKEKKLVVVPRLERFNEHTNDHQLDLARAFHREGKAISVEMVCDLEKALEMAKNFKPKTGSNRSKLVRAVKKFIEQA